jgi:hypothetical protein
MSGITQQEENKKPKERFQEILLTIFELIEDSVPEGVYLQVAEEMKKANNELNNIVAPQPQIQIIRLIQEARQNYYYRHYVQRAKPLPAKLTEAMKAKDPNYYLCKCGRFCHRKEEYVLEHLATHVHHQGLRNKKFAALKAKKIEGDELKKIDIEEEIRREVVVEGFALRHLKKQKERPVEPEPEPVVEEPVEPEPLPEPEPVRRPRRRRVANLVIEDDIEDETLGALGEVI